MPDLTKYKTELSARDELAFQIWLTLNSAAAGRDFSRGLSNYDMRGWWAENGKPMDMSLASHATTGAHFTDKFKRPNHPTFSNESIYSGQAGGPIGGQWSGSDKTGWTFQASPDNLAFQTPAQLQHYFQLIEPGNRLVLP